MPPSRAILDLYYGLREKCLETRAIKTRLFAVNKDLCYYSSVLGFEPYPEAVRPRVGPPLPETPTLGDGDDARELCFKALEVYDGVSVSNWEIMVENRVIFEEIEEWEQLASLCTVLRGNLQAEKAETPIASDTSCR